MPRFSRRRSGGNIRPVQRIKHVVDTSATVAANALLAMDIATTKDAPVLANTAECMTGSTVNGIYIRIEAASNEAISLGAIPNFYLAIWKNPGDNLPDVSPPSVGANDNKRFVIHQEMTMIENKGQGSNPRTIFNGVVVIPRGMRRMGPEDKIQALIRCPALDTAVCMQAHFKEFR